MAKQAKIKYVARYLGEIVGRCTSHRIYTHALVMQGGYRPFVAAWAGSKALAEKAVSTHLWRGRRLLAIVPAEVAKPVEITDAMLLALDGEIADGGHRTLAAAEFLKK